MNNLFFTRRVDALGRTTIPKEVCRMLDIRPEDTLEVTVEGDCVCFRRRQKPKIVKAFAVLAVEVEGIADFEKQREATAALDTLRRVLDEKEG